MPMTRSTSEVSTWPAAGLLVARWLVAYTILSDISDACMNSETQLAVITSIQVIRN